MRYGRDEWLKWIRLSLSNIFMVFLVRKKGGHASVHSINPVGGKGDINLPSTLKPIDTQEIYAKLHCTLSMSDRGTLVEHNTSGLLQLRNDWAGAVACSLDDVDALVDDGLRVRLIVGRDHGRQKRDVHSKGVLGQGPASSDLLPQVVGRGKDQACDDAQSARVGYCRGEFSVAYPLAVEKSSRQC